MCLLAVLSRVHGDSPLIVAANRDEWLERPASPFAVLAEAPRRLGGRDLLAGGTWMATSEHGVVAALTNRPLRHGADASKRSRGELPLLLTAAASAAEAAESFCRRVHAEDFNPCWLLVGDRHALYYIDVAAGVSCKPELLPRGIYVLENRPLGAPSAKAARIHDVLGGAGAWRGATLPTELQRMLASHERWPRGAAQQSDGDWRPEEVDAACVHAGPYGTRSSTVVVVPPAATEPARIWHAEGAPCVTPYAEMTFLWGRA